MTSSTDKIEKKIRENAEKEVEAIEKDAEKKISEIDDEIALDAEKAYNETINARRTEVELVPRRITSDAQLEKKKEVNAKKTEVVDSVFEKAKTEILRMGSKDKERMMKNLVDNASKNIKDPVVYVDKEYAGLVPGAKTEDLGDFGAIVRSKDGSSSVDNTLGSVMERFKTSLKPEIVKILFKE